MRTLPDLASEPSLSSPLREKPALSGVEGVGMRGILKGFLVLYSPHPNPLPLEREFSLLTVGSDASAWELCNLRLFYFNQFLIFAGKTADTGGKVVAIFGLFNFCAGRAKMNFQFAISRFAWGMLFQH